MVINHVGYTFTKPSRDRIDPNRVTFHYDELSDTLVVHLFGEPRPAFSLDVNEFEYVRIDLETNEVIGLQIEAFLTSAIAHDPRYVLWAARAGIPWETIASVMTLASSDAVQEAAVASAIQEVQDIDLAVA